MLHILLYIPGNHPIRHPLMHQRPEPVCLGALTRQCFPANLLFIPENRHDQTETHKEAQAQTRRHTEHARHTDAAVAPRPAPRRPRNSSSNIHSQTHPLNPVAINCKMSFSFSFLPYMVSYISVSVISVCGLFGNL